MTALEIIPLVEAKVYLGMDDSARDAEIQRMSKAAIQHVEAETHNILIDRIKTYYLQNGCVRVYEYPINSVVPADFTVEVKEGYSVYQTTDSTIETLALDIGHKILADIDSDLIEAAYVVLDSFFDEEAKGKIPPMVEVLLRPHKRFLV